MIASIANSAKTIPIIEVTILIIVNYNIAAMYTVEQNEDGYLRIGLREMGIAEVLKGLFAALCP
ncbi:MAG: hypothetical protein ACE5JO_00975 [Candidatus Binatia bacterium]